MVLNHDGIGFGINPGHNPFEANGAEGQIGVTRHLTHLAYIGQEHARRGRLPSRPIARSKKPDQKKCEQTAEFPVAGTLYNVEQLLQDTVLF